MALIHRVRDEVIAIARAAARDILEVYSGEFEVQRKSDTSPLTAADIAAHTRIEDGLSRLTPDIPILSEESADTISAQTRRSWTRYWLVDPLDGTREFLLRNGEFTVNIALIEDGVAIYGVIQAPVLDVVWHGGPGLGAWRLDEHGEHALHSCRPAPTPLRMVVSRTTPNASVDALLQKGDAVASTMGSSLKFCRLAEGALDLYPRFKPCSEWDTAAGQAILQGAGGTVLDLDGNPLRYNQRASLINGDFIALGDPELPWRKYLPGQ